tara:strand:+ start:4619 stop:5425 length:807 start_codon:yes stop_codon:yes gene_type:complete
MEYIKDEITVILTAWKRNHILKQLGMIKSQSKKPYQIWIYQNESHVDINISKEEKEKYNISVIQSKDINFKFHGRFVLPLLCDTEYVAIFDDDTMPQRRWFENCLRMTKKCHQQACLDDVEECGVNCGCIVGANGRTMEKNLVDATGIGDGKEVKRDTRVDFVGHCWFFKTAWCKYMWMDRPVTWENGEDIHLAAACKLHANIPCYVPRMRKGERAFWGDSQPKLGEDEHASYKRKDHKAQRGEIAKHWYNKGWKPLRFVLYGWEYNE